MGGYGVSYDRDFSMVRGFMLVCLFLFQVVADFTSTEIPEGSCTHIRGQKGILLLIREPERAHLLVY